MSPTPELPCIRQLFDPASYTFSYLVWDRSSKQAAMIDPVHMHAMRDIGLIRELGLQLRFTLETHVHTDHITGSHELRKAFDAIVAVHENCKARGADVFMRDGDFVQLGKQRLYIIHTPGHTSGDISLYIPGAVFTGDTLLVHSCGRTDYQSGDAGTMYDSITQKLFTLPDDTIVYPGHDYHGLTYSTIGAEKKYNLRIGAGRSREDFIEAMNRLKLPQPAQLHDALPNNLHCGTQLVGA